MPQAMLARVTCPNCQRQFQTPVEQILDARTNPDAKARVLNGLVNVASCPHCGAAGALNLPFIYHDPEKELALIYMPMEAGRTDLERQQAIGKLTSVAMESLPPEERKAYLLQPQVFLTMENLANKILEADGVTPEMIAEQKAQVELLQRMFEAVSDQALEAMVKENDAVLDNKFFELLDMNLEMVRASGHAEAMQKFEALRNKLLEWSSVGQSIKAGTETLAVFRAEPTRAKLLDLLTQSGDEYTRGLLIAFGRPLLDYAFFQALTARIDSASDKGEKERLVALRAEILAVRDRLDEATRALYETRAALLRDLLMSQDPETMARRHVRELDEIFINVLTANLEDAQAKGDAGAVQALRNTWSLVLKIVDEALPPEVQLFNRLITAQDEAELDELLQENRALVTETLVRIVQDITERIESQDQDTPDAAAALERVEMILNKVREVASS